MNPAESLIIAAELFENRDDEYGSGYKAHGEIMKQMLPSGIRLETPQDFAQFSHLNITVAKIQRMLTAMTRRETHADSALDIMVYMGMYLEAEEKGEVELAPKNKLCSCP